MSASDTVSVFFEGMVLPFVLTGYAVVKLVRSDEETARRDYEHELRVAQLLPHRRDA